MKITFFVASLFAANVMANCAVDESMNAGGPNRCSMNSECRGARTCNDAGWCEGVSNCDPFSYASTASVESLETEVDALKGHVDEIDLDLQALESYIGETQDGDRLINDIRSESNNQIAAAEDGIRDRTLVHLARTMLDTVGDKQGFIKDLFLWVPTTIYDNEVCTERATVVQPNITQARVWGVDTLEKREFKKKISSVMVPPGYKLELYKGNDFNGEMTTIVGKMRDDEMGIFCHKLDADWNNKATQLKLIPLH